MCGKRGVWEVVWEVRCGMCVVCVGGMGVDVRYVVCWGDVCVVCAVDVWGMVCVRSVGRCDVCG